MRFPAPLIRGTLVRRYKRFFADVTLDDGELVTAHIANTGAMLGTCDPGIEVWLSPAANPERKLRWSWELARIGVASAHLQTIYASHYVANRAKGSITWTPLSDQGNALVGGSWKIGEQKKKTTLLLSVRGSVTLPLPALMKSVLAPLVTAEFERLTESYIANLIAHWGGEA